MGRFFAMFVLVRASSSASTQALGIMHAATRFLLGFFYWVHVSFLCFRASLLVPTFYVSSLGSHALLHSAAMCCVVLLCVRSPAIRRIFAETHTLGAGCTGVLASEYYSLDSLMGL